MERLDAAAVRAWADASRAALAGSRDRIDAVNVFPVAGLRHRDERAAHRDRRGRGAGRRPGRRGRGRADAMRLRPGCHAVGPRELRRHRQPVPDRLRAGPARVSRHGRRRPVPSLPRHVPRAGRPQEPQEGTILTLADAVARSAATAADAGADLASMLGSVVADAHRALAGSAPSTLSLRAAHVWTPARAPCSSCSTPWRAWSGRAARGRSRSTGCPPPRPRRWPRPTGGGASRSCCWSATSTAVDPARRCGAAWRRSATRSPSSAATAVARARPHRRPGAAIAARRLGRREQVLVRPARPPRTRAVGARRRTRRLGCRRLHGSPDLAGLVRGHGGGHRRPLPGGRRSGAAISSGRSPTPALRTSSVLPGARSPTTRSPVPSPRTRRDVEVLERGDELRVGGSLALALRDDRRARAVRGQAGPGAARARSSVDGRR